MTMLVAHARLHPQAQLAVRLMQERGSLTAHEAQALGCGSRLAARVDEIKRAYGAGSIASEWVEIGRARVKAYRFVGLESQAELGI